MSGLRRSFGEKASPRTPVEGKRILPSLAERLGQITDHRSPDLHVQVVPRWSRAVPIIDGHDLGIALMAGVVMTSVTQVDPAHESDIVVGATPKAHHDQLLMMAAHTAHPHVEEHMPPAALMISANSTFSCSLK